ncbi:hypothetical protein B0H19DRAFT_1074191 [Mycena capillaripes]|nr:hypothetical protein B0H19DRAFT_1074191 [Mycena capillaripes]
MSQPDLIQLGTTHSRKRFPKLPIPSGSNPTGAFIREARRIEVLKLAKKYNFLLAEDDAHAFLYYGPEGTQQRHTAGVHDRGPAAPQRNEHNHLEHQLGSWSTAWESWRSTAGDATALSASPARTSLVRRSRRRPSPVSLQYVRVSFSIIEEEPAAKACRRLREAALEARAEAEAAEKEQARRQIQSIQLPSLITPDSS